MLNTSSAESFSNYSFSLEDFNAQYYYFYVHPIIMILAAFVNVLCAIVFAQKDLLSLGPFFQYSLANSIGAAIGMLLLIGYTFSRCNNLCDQDTTEFSQLYELYAIIYVCNALYFFGSLIQIAISVQLYLSVTQKFKRLNSVSPLKVIIVFLVISFALGISIIFSFKLLEIKFLTIQNDQTYVWNYVYQVYLDQSSNYAIVFISLFYIIFSNKIFLVILIVVNILLYVELKKILNKKIRLKNGNSKTFHEVPQLSSTNRQTISSNVSIITKSETVYSKNTRKIVPISSSTVSDNNVESKKKTLVMVLWVSLVFSSSRLMFAIANISFLIVPYSLFNWWAGCANVFYGACVYISYILVYMKTNKHFKKKFYQIFLRRKLNN